MSEAADFCWVGADGALHSGTAGELMHAFLSGELPARHPVWRQGWGEWVLLSEALSARLLEPEPEPEPTLREPAPFSERDSLPTLPLSEPTLVDVMDPDATFEDVTQPLRRVSLTPPTLRSEPPPRPLPLPSLPPGGLTHSVPPAPAASSTLRRSVLAGVGLALAGAAAASAILLSAAPATPTQRLRHSGARLPARSVPAASTAAVATSCSLGGAPLELSGRVAPGASLHLASAGQGRVALGVTSSERSGFGITLALDPLRVEQRQTFHDAVHLAGLVPAGESFSVDRFTRRVASFSVGMTPSGFSRITDAGAQATIWPGQAAQAISRPVVVPAGSAGFAVAFRRGDQASGTVRMGWLDAQGEKRSELGALSVASGVLDAPSLALSDDRALLAFAVRQPADAPWGIELGVAKTGELPASTLRFSGGDPSRDQQRPAVVALPGGRWLLAWAEGDRASGRRVRAQVLGAGLAPVGRPVELASTARWVGAVAAHAEGGQVLVLFSERARRQSEVLSAVRLSCR